MKAMQIGLFLVLGSLHAQPRVTTPLFPHKDGEAEALSYSGINKDLEVDGGGNPVLSWMTYQLQGVDRTNVDSAYLTLYVRTVTVPGSFRVFALSQAIVKSENNVNRGDLVYDTAISYGSVSLTTGASESIVTLNVTGAVKAGVFHGLALVSQDGLNATFGAKESPMKPFIMLTYQAMQGPKGDSGAQGTPGLRGLQGVKGDSGAMGQTGPKGDKGDTGVTGARGTDGAKGTCSATVGIGGQYDSLQAAFSASMSSGAPQDIFLCLLPGNHLLPSDVSVTGKRSIRISGAGDSASVVRFQGDQLRLQASKIKLEDFTFIATKDGGSLVLATENASVENSRFQRVGTAVSVFPLVKVEAPSLGGVVHFQNNFMKSSWQRFSPDTAAGFSVALALGSHKVGGSLTGNEIVGVVLVLNDGNFGADLGKTNVVQVITGNPINSSGATMNLTANHITRFSIYAPPSSFDPDDNGSLYRPVPCYAILNLSQNVFSEDENAFLGGTVTLQGNRFDSITSILSSLTLGNQFLATGNSGIAGASIRYRSVQTAFAANLILLSVLP